MAYRLYISFNLNEKLTYATGLLFLVVSAIELPQNAEKIIQGLDGEFAYGTIEEYKSFIDKTQPLIDAAQEEDDGFYRIEKDYEYSKNDAMLLGYNGMTHYSSTFNEHINTFTKDMGIAQTHIWNSGYGSTILTDSLFNVKYKLLENSAPSAYELKKSGDGASLYENTLVLPIAYTADSGVVDKEVEWGYDYFDNQEQFLSDLMGEYTECFNPLYVEKQAVSGGFNLIFTAQSKNPVYLNMRGYGWANVYVNNVFVGNYYSSETLCNLYLGQFSEGQKVTVYVQTDVSSYDEVVCELDMYSMEDALSTLSEGAMNVTYHEGGSIKGTVTAKEGQALFTSIPYSEGFRVKVDGNYVQTAKYADTFMVIPLEAGEHEIEISYISPGFLEGICIALFAVIIALLYYRFEIWKKLFMNIMGKKEQISDEKN